ncbi:MAG: helix-turn-helix domain-containing protein [Alphaproteobacteria bacterium]|nr:helix-turn-helix domain-containing protein [Alphaproteobacteria bacterium]
MHEEYTEKANKYKQLSAEERGKIEACCALGCSISKIAGLINRSNQRLVKKLSTENTMADTSPT